MGATLIAYIGRRAFPVVAVRPVLRLVHFMTVCHEVPAGSACVVVG